MKKPKILVVGSFVMDQIVNTDIFPRQGQTVFAKTFRKDPAARVPIRLFRWPVWVPM